MNRNKIRVLAFYLPQFHPIPENDKWYGKGFTEWTNVGKAKPLFRGHYQPRVPADLGYWHYWFGNGRRLLERPFNEVLESGKPDFPFCLAWANHSWRGIYNGVKTKESLIDQTYGGLSDYERHFYDVLPAFEDKRYVTVDGKPFFLIFAPAEIPDSREFIDCWQRLAARNGLTGIHFVAHTYQPNDIDNFLSMGYDAVNVVRLFEYQRIGISFVQKVLNKVNREVFKHGFWCQYKDAMKYFSGKEDERENAYPTIIPNWDHSPRTGRYGAILKDSTPQLFQKHVEQTVHLILNKDDDHRIVILKSWNEWAEGNYVEPDLNFGRGYLEALRTALQKDIR